MVAAARKGPPPPPTLPSSDAKKRGRGRPSNADKAEATKQSAAELRKALELEARACWLPVFMLAEKFGADAVTDEEMVALTGVTVPMLEKYGGLPIELNFVCVAAMVLAPRAWTAAQNARAYYAMRKQLEERGGAEPAPEDRADKGALKAAA